MVLSAWRVQYEEMYNRSIQDPNGFWSDMAKEFHWDKQVGRCASRILALCCSYSADLKFHKQQRGGAVSVVAWGVCASRVVTGTSRGGGVWPNSEAVRKTYWLSVCWFLVAPTAKGGGERAGVVFVAVCGLCLLAVLAGGSAGLATYRATNPGV